MAPSTGDVSPTTGPRPWDHQLPARVEMVEVGPRDGFQNLDLLVPTPYKIEITNRLLGLGFARVEVTSFVHPDAVPQMHDAAEVLAGARRDGALRMVLVPNARGTERALTGEPDMLNFVLSASETHNLANVRRSVRASLADLASTTALAHQAAVPIRVTIATSFGCPYEGYVAPEAVLDIARAATDLGATEICLGDTTGMADPLRLHRLFVDLQVALPNITAAVHLHNTRGAGAANLLAALQAGVTVVDAAVGGLGGCPYAPGASGNVTTEDVVHLLAAMGVETGVRLAELVAVALDLERALGVTLPGQVMRAGLSWQLADEGPPSRARSPGDP